MTEAITRFFESLEQRGYDPRLGGAVGTARFDVTDGDQINHWLISIDRGKLQVSRGDGAEEAVDAVLTCDSAVFDRMVRGELNGVAALLRGVVVVRGDLQLMISIGRLLPGPPGTRGPRHLRMHDGEENGRA